MERIIGEVAREGRSLASLSMIVGSTLRAANLVVACAALPGSCARPPDQYQYIFLKVQLKTPCA